MWHLAWLCISANLAQLAVGWLSHWNTNWDSFVSHCTHFLGLDWVTHLFHLFKTLFQHEWESSPTCTVPVVQVKKCKMRDWTNEVLWELKLLNHFGVWLCFPQNLFWILFQRYLKFSISLFALSDIGSRDASDWNLSIQQEYGVIKVYLSAQYL